MSSSGKRKCRILLAVTGSVATVKLPEIVNGLGKFGAADEEMEIRILATENARHFFRPASVVPYTLYTDQHEWKMWSKMGDPVLHVELRKWADVLIIAPLDANTMAKIANGICDNLLTCLVRAWDTGNKPLLFAPAMNTFMYEHPVTEQQIAFLTALGYTEIPCVKKKLACGDTGQGAMAEVSTVLDAIRDVMNKIMAKIKIKTEKSESETIHPLVLTPLSDDVLFGEEIPAGKKQPSGGRVSEPKHSDTRLRPGQSMPYSSSERNRRAPQHHDLPRPNYGDNMTAFHNNQPLFPPKTTAVSSVTYGTGPPFQASPGVVGPPPPPPQITPPPPRVTLPAPVSSSSAIPFQQPPPAMSQPPPSSNVSQKPEPAPPPPPLPPNMGQPPPNLTQPPPPNMSQPPPNMSQQPRPNMSQQPRPNMSQQPRPNMSQQPPPNMTQQPPPNLTQLPPPDMTQQPRPNLSRQPPPNMIHQPRPNMNQPPRPNMSQQPPPRMSLPPPPPGVPQQQAPFQQQQQQPPRMQNQQFSPSMNPNSQQQQLQLQPTNVPPPMFPSPNVMQPGGSPARPLMPNLSQTPRMDGNNARPPMLPPGAMMNPGLQQQRPMVSSNNSNNNNMPPAMMMNRPPFAGDQQQTWLNNAARPSLMPRCLMAQPNMMNSLNGGQNMTGDNNNGDSGGNTSSNVNDAVDAVVSGRMSTRAAAALYKIDRQILQNLAQVIIGDKSQVNPQMNHQPHINTQQGGPPTKMPRLDGSQPPALMDLTLPQR